MRTKQPTFRVTRWLRTSETPGREIPLEAECTACADARFILKHDVRKSYHQPDHDLYLAQLSGLFDAHVKAVHSKKARE